MKKIVYPGTFDPIHRGHLDIAKRASKLFDELIFAVADNATKKPLFTVDERVELIQKSTQDFPNVRAMSTNKLIVEVAKNENACALIRGLRHVSDFEFEFQMAMMNYHLDPEITTIFMMPDEKYIHLNSTVIKEVTKLGGDLTDYVSKDVYNALKIKYSI
ncbi:MAG: pantetheine-phosphate adenylyltransferase [Candidatus Marinimicrobia bacterium]|jgi:pantetheine-phosphate adenylyltransferase|nr:pantetheine-phosphate adenylyltransferase [Candidatus Neomarinimicrobiota bacterium]MBT3496076.1 pantetheine-phosphate adenylyltransferase [Candidatus Neomarinimicrobiota bacterium]MBT3692510.1 pantetheine-phosphate adenylyltransferase [Candidatus Neomarinimicrobiota bacterium]MBT3732991.1 pantetheine-phosphate adenylyltransferase [Candidatus Neomarinimicrobiota bacterium]MBT4144077.1 pantetheine-phosphate adenylyltransferase [Candidatus Neomarinimicrobiota bacterium]